MMDLEFHNQGVQNAKGRGRLLVPARRLLRRLLRPMFQAQVALYRALFQRDDQLGERLDACHSSLSHRVERLDACFSALSHRVEHLGGRLDALEAFHRANRLGGQLDEQSRRLDLLDQRDQATIARMDLLEMRDGDLLALGRRLAMIEDTLTIVERDHAIPGQHRGHVVPGSPHRPQRATSATSEASAEAIQDGDQGSGRE